MSRAPEAYESEYLQANPTWHLEDSPWKAQQILDLLEGNKLEPKSVIEVGCGAGEILRVLSDKLAPDARFAGYEISRPAYEMSLIRAHDRLRFNLADYFTVESDYAELLLVMDVIEHIEDFYGFLKGLRGRSEYLIFNIPIDFNAYAAIRQQILSKSRKQYGHIHHFNQTTALAALSDAGYEIIDHQLVSLWLDPEMRRIHKPPTLQGKLLTQTVRMLWSVSPTWGARLFGGGSVLVLAR
jgi:SAM-dependent methyltransferase